MDYAERRKIMNDDLQLWLPELKDAAYNVEDVLDNFKYEIIQEEVCSQQQVSFYISRQNFATRSRSIAKWLVLADELLDEFLCLKMNP